MSERELDVACPHGLFVLRCDLDLTAPREERLAAIRGPWAFSRWTSVWLRHRIGLYGAFPLVATVAGFVQIGADIIDVLPEGDGRVLRLRDPGPWFDQVGDRRVQTGPGRPWAIRGWDPSASPGEVRRVG